MPSAMTVRPRRAGRGGVGAVVGMGGQASGRLTMPTGDRALANRGTGDQPEAVTPTRATPPGETTDSLAGARERLSARDPVTLAAQIELTAIAAPTGAEQERAAWMRRRFVALGLSNVRIDESGNVIGRRNGLAPDTAPVVVCAHLDTVFPAGTDLRVRREGARLHAPGIGDNGRGLAAMLALAEEIDGRQTATSRPIDFVATTGEEGLGDLRGAKGFFARGERPSAVIALDGAGDERIVHRALASRRYRIVFRGTGGHSWAAFGVANPVHAAGLATSRLSSLLLPREPRTTLSVGRIGGGISVNAIPEEGWLEVDLRSVSPALIERLDREIRRVVKTAEADENARRTSGTDALTCSVDIIGDRPGGETPRDHPLVVAAAAATSAIAREPELVTASTDANVPISLGIPAIAIGAGGRGGDAHTVGEWYENADGPAGLVRALDIVLAAARPS